MVQIDLSNIWEECSPRELLDWAGRLEEAQNSLYGRYGQGGGMTGWLRLPERVDMSELERIEKTAADVRKQSDVLLVIGTGGSYLGARALIELLRSPYYNSMSKGTPDIFFVGNSISTRSYLDISELVAERDFSICVISKSGGTLEPAIAFRVFRRALEIKYGPEAAKRRIFTVTGAHGMLRDMSRHEGYECFSVPEDVGGRYSVFTPVGLLPAACAGLDIRALVEGAREEMEVLAERDLENPAWQYAAARNMLYGRGKKIELLAAYEPGAQYLGEWWKQLFGESEGKDKKGIFPAYAGFTADLHSLGQYIQEGERSLFETVLTFDPPERRLAVEPDHRINDGLSFIEGMSLDVIEERTRRGVLAAHVSGGVPNILIDAGAADERGVGALMYFFMMSCGLSGYLLGVNPFNQPGVEDYKLNMLALLGKPGLEDRRKMLDRLS